MKEAYLYKKLDNLKVRCDLCNHRCLIKSGSKGTCGVRENRDGVLYSMVYDRVISENIDPIEKKPLFHFLPGSLSLSIATPGCNFKCFFCQNWQISQMPCDLGSIEGREIPPEKIVKDAISHNCRSISYTYTEPTIYFELAYDTAKLANKNYIKNIFVTNGFMTEECLDMISSYLDAANVDLKGFSESFYREKVGGRLAPVLENIRKMYKLGIWIEVTTLLIPGLNDSASDIQGIAAFLKSVSDSIPWHISAYYPQYKSRINATSPQSVVEAIEIGKKTGLKYVYGGNVSLGAFEDTFCSSCGHRNIKRSGFSIVDNKIKNGACSSCGNKLEGKWE